MVFLASGAVNIAGTLVLDGANGPNVSGFGADWISERVPTIPGAGAALGGVAVSPGTAAYPGLGPGGASVQSSLAASRRVLPMGTSRLAECWRPGGGGESVSVISTYEKQPGESKPHE